MRRPEASCADAPLEGGFREIAHLPHDRAERAGGSQQGERRTLRHPAGERHQPAEQNARTHRRHHAAERAGPGLGRADAGGEARAAERPPGRVSTGIARPDHGEEPEDRRPACRVVAPQRERCDYEEENDSGPRQARGAGPQPAALHCRNDDCGRCDGGGRRRSPDHGEEHAGHGQARDTGHARGVGGRPGEKPPQFEPGEETRHPHRSDEDRPTEIGGAERGGREDGRRGRAQAETASAAARPLARHARSCHINATIDR